MECGDFTLILQSGEKRAKIDLSQFTEEKPELLPEWYNYLKSLSQCDP